MILIVDNFDSFTWNLVDYVRTTGIHVELVRNDVPPESTFKKEIIGLILSPGPGKPENSGFLNQYISFYENKCPILGICLGHQAIAAYYGAKIIKALEPRHGKISRISIDTQDPLFDTLPEQINVVRYHSLITAEIPESLHAIAHAQDANMGFSHNQLPIKGIQFHPEAYLTDYGHKMISNWVDFCRKIVVE